MQRNQNCNLIITHNYEILVYIGLILPVTRYFIAKYHFLSLTSVCVAHCYVCLCLVNSQGEEVISADRAPPRAPPRDRMIDGLLSDLETSMPPPPRYVYL